MAKICKITSSASGDKSTPPISGKTRRIGASAGLTSRSSTSAITELVCTQDKIA